MKCNNCQADFGRFQIVDGIKHDINNRKTCLQCVPIGKREYPTKIGSQCQCVECGKQYIYLKQNGTSTKCCKTCYGIKARHELKKKAVTYKGGKCTKCGYCKAQSALEFHHTNPLEKDFQISGNHTRKWESIKTELDKCELLCANCHREVHEESGI